jgi:hypothetical protein
MRMIAYGMTDYTDEYLSTGEYTTLECMQMFAKVFGDEYLRSRNNEDTIRPMSLNEKRGWPRMLRSLDCMHWRWKNCPTA